MERRFVEHAVAWQARIPGGSKHRGGDGSSRRFRPLTGKIGDEPPPPLVQRGLESGQVRGRNVPADRLQAHRAGLCCRRKTTVMKARSDKAIEQPKPFTPGVTRAMVRQHAYEMFRDKLPDHPLTLEDWVLAEKDLVNSLEADDLPK